MIRIGGGGKHGGRGRLDMGESVCVCLCVCMRAWWWREMLLIGQILIKW